MRLYEYESKYILRDFGINVPDCCLVTSLKEAGPAYEKLGGDVMAKAQIPLGGRMKAGGVKSVDNPKQLSDTIENLLGSEMRGCRVEKVLIEKRLCFENEYYLGITYDLSAKQAIVVFSTAGGIEVEQTDSAKIGMIHWDLTQPLPAFKCRELLSKLDSISGSMLL